MDVSERLTDQQLAQPGYLAASHLHRYAVARELCRGLGVLDLGCGTGYGTAVLAETAAEVTGVDIAAEAIAAARAAHRALTFTVADAAEALRATDAEAVVCFEALEHVADLAAVLAELKRLRGAGVRMVLSVPNSNTFGEENDFHVTDYDWAQARQLCADLDGVLLCQYLTEGSLVQPADGADVLSAEVVAPERAEPEYANAFICVAGFDVADVATATARLGIATAPSHNRYMLDLERVNAELFSTNRQLVRGLFGREDAAAAAAVDRLQRQQEELEILREELALAREHVERVKRWYDARRYRVADAVHRRLRRIL